MRVYVAGAYSDSTVLGVLRNIGRGQDWSASLFLAGFSPFVPWLDKEFVFLNWEQDFKVSEFYEYSIDWLSVSDAVFVVPNFPGMKNWEDSVGVAGELQAARERDIPIFHDLEDLCTYADLKGFKTNKV